MRLGLAVLLSLSLSGTPVFAACWEAEEYEAARMRDLQTVLMVSALKCGRADTTMPAAYNRWVGRAKATLVEGEQKLLAHFVREGDKAKYDKFTTALANRYSEYAEHPKFCNRARALMEADERQNGILQDVALLINSKPNGVDEVCPVKRPPTSQILVSPFDPIAEPQAVAVPAAAAQPTAPAPSDPASTPAPVAASATLVSTGPVVASAEPAAPSALAAAPATPAATASPQPQ
jgi:hypothetical protein